MVKKNSRHFLDQSEVKLKPIVTRSRKFSRVSWRQHVFAFSFSWFARFYTSFVIGRSDYMVFVYDTKLVTALKYSSGQIRWLVCCPRIGILAQAVYDKCFINDTQTMFLCALFNEKRLLCMLFNKPYNLVQTLRKRLVHLPFCGPWYMSSYIPYIWPVNQSNLGNCNISRYTIA